MARRKEKGYKFECWEIDFPGDDEDTRGVSKEAAYMMLRLGWIDIQHEGIIKNTYGERVLSHCYAPTSDANEPLAYRAAADAVFDDMTVEQQHRMLVLWLLVQDYHRSHKGDYDDTFSEFHYSYFPWAEEGDDADPNEFRDACEEIPRFAVIMHDETYSMIHMADSKVGALKLLTDSLGADTLGTNGDVIDLDDTVLHTETLAIRFIGTVANIGIHITPELHKWLTKLVGQSAGIGVPEEVLEEARFVFSEEHEPALPQ